MNVAWSGHIGSQEGDVMGLCDGAERVLAGYQY